MVERGLRRSAVWLVSGVALGMAERVPGASAASLAIALGAYPQLLQGLGGMYVVQRDGSRWAPLAVVGMVLAGLGVCQFLVMLGGFCCTTWFGDAVLPRAFWFGFLTVAAPLIAARVRRWSLAPAALLLLGTLVGVVLGRVELAQVDRSPGDAFVGTVAGAAALLVPGGFGLSALRASGLIDHAAAAFGHADVWFLALFAAGLIAGVVLAARLLHRLLRRFPDPLLAWLLGVMCSGLPRAWPWQRVDAYTLTAGGDTAAVATTPLWPWQYFAATGADASSLPACAVMLVAGLLALLVARGTGYAAAP